MAELIQRIRTFCSRRPKTTETKPQITIIPHHLLEKKSKQQRRQHAVHNEIKTTKYTLWNFIPKNLFIQFHRYANFYFLFVIVINWLPQVALFGKEVSFLPLLAILAATAIKDAYEDFRRYKADRIVNASPCRIWDSSAKRYKQVKWKDVGVGDFLHLSCNEVIPADTLLLRSADSAGVCFVESSNLDGETNLKQRRVVDFITDSNFCPNDFNYTLKCGLPDNQIYKFNGYLEMGNDPEGSINVTMDNVLLRGCQIKNTDFVEGIVLYTGHNTKAIQNTTGSRAKRSLLESKMNWDILWAFIILLVLNGVCTAGGALWLQKYKDGAIFIPSYVTAQNLAEYIAIGFLTKFVTFSYLVPLSLFVTMELVKLSHVYLLNKDKEMVEMVNGEERKIECRALNITEDLGQIQYILSDKTGTLTDNVMIFRSCTIAGTDYSGDTPYSDDEATQDAFLPDLGTEMTVDTNLKKQCAKLNGSLLNPASAFSSNEKDILAFLLTMAICNTVVVNKRPHEDNLSETGLPELRASGGEELTERTASTTCSTEDRKKPPRPHIYEAESPDELALVNAASELGMKLLKKQTGLVTVEMPDGSEATYKVLEVLKFDSVRKQMSIVIQSPASEDSVILLTKGADSSILSRLEDEKNMSHRSRIQLFKAHESLQLYSSRGLRTLCLAKKVMPMVQYMEWWREYKEATRCQDDAVVGGLMGRLESGLDLLGVTGIEDKLQPGVPESISSLRKAGIKIWVLTGDKVETAVNIAYSCRLFTIRTMLIHLQIKSQDEAGEALTAKLNEFWSESGKGRRQKSEKIQDMSVGLVLDGSTLANCITKPEFMELASLCSVVLCCRASPIQKAEVVALVKKKLNGRTLAVGDGANDVSMIQAADIGVGINGLEGRQAVLASDFALPRFRLLNKLLLVHGHWSYQRVARLIPYFHYRNMTDPLFAMMNHLFFSTPPGMAVAMLDQSCEERLLLREPKLYATGRKSKLYGRSTYWIMLADTLWQSLVCFYVPFFLYRGTTTNMHHFGLLVFYCSIICTQAHLAVTIQAWTWFFVLIMVFCMTFLIVFTLIYSKLVVPGINKNPPYFAAQMVLARPVNYFVFLFVALLAIFFRLTFKIFKNSLRPPAILRARLQMKLRDQLQEDSLLQNPSTLHTTL